MIPDNTLNNSAPLGFSSYLATSGNKFWALTLLLSLLVPPAGVLIVIYLLTAWLRKRPTSRSYLTTITLIIAAVIVGAISYLKFYEFLYDRGIKYSYSKLETYKMEGDQESNSNGMIFLKPVEFTAVAENKKTNYSNSSLAHKIGADKKQNLGLILAFSTLRNPKIDDSAYIKNTNALMQTQSGSDYEGYKKTLEKFIAASTGSQRFSVDITQASSVHTTNIKQKAWQFDYQTKNDSKSGPYKTGEILRKGRLIFAFGNNAYYYFLIDTAPKNWESNSQIWQQIINNLKIDQ